MLGLSYSHLAAPPRVLLLGGLLALPTLVVGCDGEGFHLSDHADDSPPGSTGSGGWEPGDGGDDSGGSDSGGAVQTPTGGNDTCDQSNGVELFLSPDDSNSMSSPVQAREAVLDGWSSLGSVALRTWEFLNYYSFAYPPAAPGEIAVTTELYRDPDAPAGEYILQVAVTPESVSNANRDPVDVTLVLDTSGSMEGHALEMLKETSRAIASSLHKGDRVSMVTWDSDNAVILAGYEVAGPNDPLLLDEIEGLRADGGTDLHDGLVAGYDLALSIQEPGRINRLVLVSDGGANVGVTDRDIIGAHAGAVDEDGIYLVGVGVGTADDYHDALMDTVTDAGKGASVFVPDVQEAWRIFGDRFVSTMSVAARDVRVKLELPPGFEVVRFSGEELDTDPAAVEPQHLAPNASMVFHQTIQTCAPDLVDDATELGVTVRFRDAVTFEETEVSEVRTFGELLARPVPMLHKGAAVYEYAETLKTWRRMYGNDEAALAVTSAVGRLEKAEALLPGDPDLAEIRAVLESLE